MSKDLIKGSSVKSEISPADDKAILSSVSDDPKCDFIYYIKLIKPLENIISGLKDKRFDDSSIEFLNNKLDVFVEFAAKTMGETAVMSQRESVKPAYMNDYARNYYLKYFEPLLNYFKSF